MQWIYYIIGLFISLILLFIDYSYSIGIVVALLALLLLSFLRNKFHKQIMGLETFNSKLFISYTLLVVLIMFIPLGLAFFMPELINPYFVAGTIFLERIFNFLINTIFTDKEELNV